MAKNNQENNKRLPLIDIDNYFTGELSNNKKGPKIEQLTGPSAGFDLDLTPTQVDRSPAAAVADQKLAMSFAAAAVPTKGSGGKGIGGGDGRPSDGIGGGQGGGGGKGGGGGRPGGEGVGNNLSFAAIFPEGAPVLRVHDGDPSLFLFSNPYGGAPQADGYYYFAQGDAGNVWQAGSIAGSTTAPRSSVIDVIDIGDALETAPISVGRNVRLELSLYEELETPLMSFEMGLLGGAKGGGKPTTKGPTELQGARLAPTNWTGTPYVGDTDSGALLGTTFESNYATVYAAKPAATGEETPESYMTLSIQSVSGLNPGDELTGMTWNGSMWQDTNSSDGITVGTNNLAGGTQFAPELNIAGKYIMGASGMPFKFTNEGSYLVSFVLKEGAPISFSEDTAIANYDLGTREFVDAGGDFAVLADDYLGLHNGVVYSIVTVPRTVTEGEG